MKLIFMGTPDFAVPCLEGLIASKHDVLAVFSQPDKPKGRGYTLLPTPVKQCAVDHGIEVHQPPSLKADDVQQLIRSYNADAIIVVAYGKILPPQVLSAAKYGCINVHASLLPKYRGAAPIQWAILAGEEETGVTIMQMDAGLDTGDILSAKKTKIGANQTSAELFDELAHLGAGELVVTLDLLEAGSITAVPQGESPTPYAKMITKQMAEIDWQKAAQQVHNQIRAFVGWPVAVTTYAGKRLKLHASLLTTQCASGTVPGQVVSSSGGLFVACGDGKVLEITQLQLDGKKKMAVIDFLRGNKINCGEILGG